MDISGSLPSLPPIPPNFASSPLELVQSTGLQVVVSQISPVLHVSILTPIGSIPLFFDMPPPVGFGRYGEF